MSNLSLALYCEGSTDNRFLPPIIEKTARNTLDALQLRHVSVSSLHIIEVKRKKRVELIAKPKLRLKSAVHMAYASRSKWHRQIDIDFLYEPLGQSISMERLKQVPSYQQFVNDLTEVLTALYPIPQVYII